MVFSDVLTHLRRANNQKCHQIQNVSALITFKFPRLPYAANRLRNVGLEASEHLFKGVWRLPFDFDPIEVTLSADVTGIRLEEPSGREVRNRELVIAFPNAGGETSQIELRNVVMVLLASVMVIG